MAKRKFVYSSSGVKEVTPEECRELCDEISQDAATRSEPLEFGLPHSRWRERNATAWPVHSDAFGCSDAEAVREEQEILAKHGVKCEYDGLLRPVWTGKSHKKAYMRALGYADPDACYGDAEPIHWSGQRRPDLTDPCVRKERLEKARQEVIEKELKLFGCRISSL